MRQLLDRITADPHNMGGTPCIQNTRVTVATIIGLLSAGRSAADILQACPYLNEEDIRATLASAAQQMHAMDVPQTL